MNTKILKFFLPREVKEMLERLKGSKTLILLVIANLPNVADAVGNLLSGTGHEAWAVSLTKAVAGLLSILTVGSRLIPDPDPPAKISEVHKIVADKLPIENVEKK